MTDLETTIRRFIARDIMGEKHESAVKVDDLLLENGILDSAGILEMVAFLETELGIEVSDNEIEAENFMSVESIAQLVKRSDSSNGAKEAKSLR